MLAGLDSTRVGFLPPEPREVGLWFLSSRDKLANKSKVSKSAEKKTLSPNVGFEPREKVVGSMDRANVRHDERELASSREIDVGASEEAGLDRPDSVSSRDKLAKKSKVSKWAEKKTKCQNLDSSLLLSREREGGRFDRSIDRANVRRGFEPRDRCWSERGGRPRPDSVSSRDKLAKKS